MRSLLQEQVEAVGHGQALVNHGQPTAVRVYGDARGSHALQGNVPALALHITVPEQEAALGVYRGQSLAPGPEGDALDRCVVASLHLPSSP